MHSCPTLLLRGFQAGAHALASLTIAPGLPTVHAHRHAKVSFWGTRRSTLSVGRWTRHWEGKWGQSRDAEGSHSARLCHWPGRLP
eukprot:1139481-Pelagomonas_calceolata.AAC.1